MQGFVGLPLILITRALDNPTLEQLLAELRSRSGNRVVHKRKAVREMVKALREGLGVAIVIDQDALNDGVFVPFFDQLASTTPTLARIAIRTGAAIVPTFSVPEKDGSFRIVYGPEVEIGSTSDIEADSIRITAECTAIVEKWVRAYPQHWLWMHRRWKTPAPLLDSTKAPTP
jgi:KDO2-lipid IV(A) lauroyltransferase